jgi:AraC-like DNA-binding protein
MLSPGRVRHKLPERAGPVSNRVARALQLVSTRYQDPPGLVAAVAAAMRLSSSHLNKLVRQDTGITIREHVVRLRMDAAIRHLRDGILSVKEIAAQIGYSSSSAFDHEFTKRFGCPPREWQRRFSSSRIPQHAR